MLADNHIWREKQTISYLFYTRKSNKSSGLGRARCYFEYSTEAFVSHFECSRQCKELSPASLLNVTVQAWLTVIMRMSVDVFGSLQRTALLLGSKKENKS